MKQREELLVHHPVFLDIGHPKHWYKWSHGKVTLLNAYSVRHGALLYLGTMRPTICALLVHIFGSVLFDSRNVGKAQLNFLPFAPQAFLHLEMFHLKDFQSSECSSKNKSLQVFDVILWILFLDF